MPPKRDRDRKTGSPLGGVGSPVNASRSAMVAASPSMATTSGAGPRCPSLAAAAALSCWHCPSLHLPWLS